MIVGVCFLAAFVFLLFRAGDLSPGYVTLRTFLDDAADLMDGAQVRLSGIPIGYLDAQKLTNSRNPRPKSRIRLESERAVPAGDPGGFGSGPGLRQSAGRPVHRDSARPERGARQPGAELATTQTQDITRMMAQMSKQLDRLQDVVTLRQQIDVERDTGKGAIGKIARKSAGLAPGFNAELNQLMADTTARPRHNHEAAL